MLNDQTSTPVAIFSPSQPMLKTKSKVVKNKPKNDRWAQSQHVLLSWTIDMTKSMHALSQFRFRANANAWKSLISCKNPAELIGLQLGHVETATAQYRDYAQGVSRQMQQCAQDMAPSGIIAGES